MLIQTVYLITFSMLNVIVIVGTSGALTYKTYTKLQDSNIRYKGNLITSFTTVSKVSCSSLCTTDSDCVVFGYNKIVGECEHYYNIVSDGTVSMSGTGWIMYTSNVVLDPCTDTLLLNYRYPLRFTTTKLQHGAANDACINDGLKLVKIDTSLKMEFIRSIIKNCSNYQNIGFWVEGSNSNATDFYADNAWTFNDGTTMPMTLDFWCNNKPDNPHKEHCVRLNKGSCDHYLNDKECTDTFGYICEP